MPSAEDLAQLRVQQAHLRQQRHEEEAQKQQKGTKRGQAKRPASPPAKRAKADPNPNAPEELQQSASKEPKQRTKVLRKKNEEKALENLKKVKPLEDCRPGASVDWATFSQLNLFSCY